jgi:hypothetical protein
MGIYSLEKYGKFMMHYMISKMKRKVVEYEYKLIVPKNNGYHQANAYASFTHRQIKRR